MFFDTEKDLPLVFVKDAVIFPGILVELFFSNKKCQRAIDVLGEKKRLILVTQRNLATDDPTEDDLYLVGVAGRVTQIEESGLRMKVVFEAEERVFIERFLKDEPYFRVEFKRLKEDRSLNDTVIALKNSLIAGMKKLVNSGRSLPLEIVIKLLSTDDPVLLVNNLIPILDIDLPTKQDILETESITGRLEKANTAIYKVLQVADLEDKMAEKTQEELSKTQKEVLLREEMKTIQKELGENEINEFDGLRAQIKEAKMPELAEKTALKELSRLEKTPSFSPEISLIRNYLDWLITMPWSRSSAHDINIEEAKRILNNDHYGLEKVKERILEFLAVSKLAGKTRGQILCFVGPPGTGKTSIGKSIAHALSKKFVRISLGGIRDEAEIRGHRRTYVGAMPGRIIQGIKQAGEKDPVFMLDEIDKIGADFRGDPASALLEALDPEQNANFSDHYLEVPFDLSGVMFITTANILDTIPPALRDRMEVIEFFGYTPEEKLNIAKKFIWPKVVLENGLFNEDISIDDVATMTIITDYTREAGVRNLERELSKIARKAALDIVESKDLRRNIKIKELINLIGLPKIEQWTKEVQGEIGLVAALAVTEAGGEVLSVEATFLPGGHGNLTLTGHLGDVMKESAVAALSYARTVAPKFEIDPKIFSNSDVHIHVPLGAVPKDGPSAGAAIASAIISALIKKPIIPEIGMTGELTLRGRVLRIGGLKEKILAAKRAGLKKIIIPEANKEDLREIQEEHKKDLDFSLVKTMNEVLPLLFDHSYGAGQSDLLKNKT